VEGPALLLRADPGGRPRPMTYVAAGLIPSACRNKNIYPGVRGVGYSDLQGRHEGLESPSHGGWIRSFCRAIPAFRLGKQKKNHRGRGGVKDLQGGQVIFVIQHSHLWAIASSAQLVPRPDTPFHRERAGRVAVGSDSCVSVAF
jgi:hypothetical protein